MEERWYIGRLILIALVLLFCGLVKAQDNSTRTLQVVKEKQPIADQGNGYYKNPIFSGNFGDPSLIRIEDDYYIAFSRRNGIIIFHSKDLVNWQPKSRHRLPEGYNSVWAIDLQYFNDKFHIYMPIREYPGKKRGPFANFVITAERAKGPWSEPINLEIDAPNDSYYSGIDPGFIQTQEGEKYLFVNHGWVVQLNADGTKAVTKPKIVYEGWDYPEDWIVECHCLESPKLFYKDGFYYMVSAEGGTSGPSTAHMSIVARAKHPMGPWENSPYNPLTKTYSQKEMFWHQGHGTIFEDKDGEWWTVFHGRLNNFEGMGRPTLLKPIKWTPDGWPVEKAYPSDALIPKPHGQNVGNGFPYSDDFAESAPGYQWYFDNALRDHLNFGNRKLVMASKGQYVKESMQIAAYAPNKSYTITVNLKNLSEDNIGGIQLGDNGIASDGKNVFFSDVPDWRKKHSVYPIETKDGVWLKITNFKKDLSFYYSTDGKVWEKFADSMRSSDSYRFSLFSYGSGKTEFYDFRYQGLE